MGLYLLRNSMQKNMGMSFFGMPLAQTWLARTKYHDKDAILVTNKKRYSQSRARAGLIYS